MKISIVTVCFNANAVIRGVLDSVASQSHDEIEHILIDGNSNDGTVETIRRYPHVATFVSESDNGIYDAMNKGLTHVTGDYVLFLNADDRFPASTTLATAVAAMAADPGADVYYGWLEVRPRHGSPHVFRPPPPAEAAEFLITGALPHQATLARPSVFARTGPFDLRYRYHADYDWFVKIVNDPMIDIRAIPCVVGSFLEGGASSDLTKGQPEVFEIQNEAQLYAGENWNRRRIEALQKAWLRERIESARLQELLLSKGRLEPARAGSIALAASRIRRLAVRVRNRLMPGSS